MTHPVRKGRGVSNRRHRAAMMRAIERAAEPGLFAGSSKTDGLRAIRLFEEVNRRSFDPFDSIHLALVGNSGWHFALQRRLAKLSEGQESAVEELSTWGIVVRKEEVVPASEWTGTSNLGH